MSSFKAKVEKQEKQKSTRATKKETPSGTSTPKEHTEGTTEPTPEQVPAAAVAIEQAPSSNAEEYYGEDQQEEVQGKPKFERAIPLDRIRPNPYQPRKTFDPDTLKELADGMREHGWIGGGLPVRAHASEPNTYELVWGERRWRAAGLAGLKAIPCVIGPYSEEDMIEKGLLENVQREDLTNMEEGQAYVNLLALRTEEGKPRYSIRRLAARLGKDKSYIEERLKFARVPVDIQQLAIDQPDISPRIIHELGELSKILQPEERASVVEGVRAGKLRIEDVREIRQDVEQQIKQQPTEVAAPEPTPSDEQADDQQSTPAQLPTTLSVATDTQPSTHEQEAQPEVSGLEPATASITEIVEQQPEQSIPAPVASLAPAVAVSVFEKTLKRDNEALERIMQRLTTTFTSLTESERTVLLYYLKRWDTGIQDLIQQLEPTEEQSEEQ
jgi:ParB family chromosome partitioning protein